MGEAEKKKGEFPAEYLVWLKRVGMYHQYLMLGAEILVSCSML